MNTVLRGAVAEMLVAAELLKLDFNISMPINHHSEYDLIADTGNKLVRIQVKRAYKTKNKGYESLCVETRRVLVKHSGEKGSVVSRYSECGYDYLIACDVDNNNFWIMPKSFTDKYKAQIYLGKSKECFKNEWII